MKTLILVLALALPVRVFAEDVCEPQDYDSEDEPNFNCPSPEEGLLVPHLNPPASIPVAEGESVTAPWDGALVHRDRMLKLGSTITAVRRLRWNDRLRLLAEYRIMLNYSEEICDANANHSHAETEIYREALQTANERVESSQAWFRSPWFGFTIGFISAAALVALSAYVLMAI